MTMKGIEFKAVLNTSEMDAKIQQLQQKLRTISSQTGVGDKARSIYGEGSQMTERAQRLQEGFNQRNLQMLREEFNLRDRLYKSQEGKLKQINDLMERSKKGTKEELDLLNDKVKTEEKLLRLQNEQNTVAEKYKNIVGTTEGLGVGTGGGGLPPAGGFPAGAGGGAGGDQGLIGKLIGAMGVATVTRALVQGVQGAANLGAEMYEYQQTKAGQQAAIAQGAFGASGAGAMLTGQGVRSMFFAQERLRAFKNAEQAQGAMNLRGFGSTVAEIGGSAITGAGIGGGIGATIGSVVPGLGTVVGGTAGAVIGGNIGGLYGLGKSLFQGQTGAGIKGALAGENPVEAIDRYRAQKFFADMEANQKAEEAKDPYKQIAFDYFEQNKGRFLQAQQMSGMTDEELMGPNGFLSGATGSFTTSQKLGAMSAIYGAGGSSAQGRNAQQALELQRSYGLQNAPQIVAGLSKGIGGGIASSDEVVRKIMGDAFSVGLDASKFGREAEKFLTISAKFVEESGARTMQDQQKVAAEMASFVTGTSMKQVEAAGEARGFLESNLGAGGGQYQKALQMSKMRSSGLSGLTEAQKTSLANMSPDQIKAGGLEIEAMAQQVGMTKEQFEKSAMGVKEFGMTQSGAQADRLKKLKAGAEKYGINLADMDQLNQAIQAETDPTRKKELMDLKKESGMYISGFKSELGLGGKGSQFAESLFSGQLGFGELRKPTGAAPEQKTGVFTEREKAEARMDQNALVNATTKDYVEAYASSVKSVADSSAILSKALEVMAAAIKTGNPDLIKSATYTAADIAAGGTGKNVRPSMPSGVRSAKDM